VKRGPFLYKWTPTPFFLGDPLSYQLSSQEALINSPPKGLSQGSPTKPLNTTKSPIMTLPQIKLSLSKRKAFKIKTFSSKREERRLKISNEEIEPINMPSISKVNTQSQDLPIQ